MTLPPGPEPTRRTAIAALLAAAPAALDGQAPRPADGLFRQAGAPAAQTLQAKVGRVIDVDDFRLPDDADDTPAFRRAVAALIDTGGEIRTDPRKRYTLSEGIVIASLHHVAITGANFGHVFDATGPGIAITAPMASLFRVAAPGARGKHGGVSFRNLSFYDASGRDGTPGRNAIGHALLDLRDACGSHVENCQFHWIAGSAIHTDFFVQSSVTGCRFRYCGAAGRKVLHLGGTDIAHTSQSVTISDTRMEVCHGDAYLCADAATLTVTLSGCMFEAATTEYPGSNVPFVDLDGIEYKLIGCAFNRNLAPAVVLRGRGIVTGCSFETGPAATESLQVPGSRNVMTANTFTDTRLRRSVRVTGVLNLMTANRFYASGGIALDGANNQFHSNLIDSPTMAGGDGYLTLVDHCAATGNHFNGHDFTGTGYRPAVDAVALRGANVAFTGNSCRGWAGTFIRVESATATFRPNTHDGIGVIVATGR